MFVREVLFDADAIAESSGNPTRGLSQRTSGKIQNAVGADHTRR